MGKLRREIIRGQPIRIGSHAVVPEAEVWSWQTKEVVIGQAGHVSGRGALIAWARPTALIDRAARRTRRVPIRDRNRQLELILLAAAVLLPIVLSAAGNLLRDARVKSSP